MNKKSTEDKQILDGKIFAVLSYLSIFCIIPLIFKKDNVFVLDHGKQGLVLFVAEVASFVMHVILGNWFLNVSTFVFGVLSLIGIVRALQGEYVKLPGVFVIAQKITL